MEKIKIKTIFLDVGSVLLSNGWDRYSRQRAIKKFNLNPDELSDRHHIFFETYEMGKLPLSEYLDHVIFYEPRNFSRDEFVNFMFQQSVVVKDSIEYFMAIKKKYRINIFSLNNEGKELNEYRIKTFRLDELFNGFISSCYVHLRKPDKEIFKVACDITFTEPAQGLFIDDRIIHVQIARSLGLHAIQFKSLKATKKLLQPYGFNIL